MDKKHIFTQTNEFGIVGKKDEIALAFNFPSSSVFENQTPEIKNFRGHDIFKIFDNQINSLIHHITNNTNRKNYFGCFLKDFFDHNTKCKLSRRDYRKLH